jgi:hypothetical protein
VSCDERLDIGQLEIAGVGKRVETLHRVRPRFDVTCAVKRRADGCRHAHVAELDDLIRQHRFGSDDEIRWRPAVVVNQLRRL